MIQEGWPLVDSLVTSAGKCLNSVASRSLQVLGSGPARSVFTISPSKISNPKSEKLSHRWRVHFSLFSRRRTPVSPNSDDLKFRDSAQSLRPRTRTPASSGRSSQFWRPPFVLISGPPPPRHDGVPHCPSDRPQSLFHAPVSASEHVLSPLPILPPCCFFSYPSYSVLLVLFLCDHDFLFDGEGSQGVSSWVGTVSITWIFFLDPSFSLRCWLYGSLRGDRVFSLGRPRH